MMIEFLIFTFLQALLINGVHICFNGGVVNDLNKGKIYSGMIFYMVAPKFFEENKNKPWAKPVYSCIKCMSSVWGTITFWPVAIVMCGFHGWEIGLWIADMFILVPLNYFIYQKI